MKYIKLIFIFLFPVFIQSCTASSYITDWRDPSFSGKIRKVMVVALIKDFEYRLAYETQITDILKEAGVEAESSMNLFGLETKITKDELISILKKGGFDAMLAVKYTGSKSYTTFVPYGSFYNWYSSGFDYMYSSGYIEKHTQVNTEAILFTKKSENAVWFASLKTINAYSRENLAKSLASEIGKSLIDNAIIKYSK